MENCSDIARSKAEVLMHSLLQSPILLLSALLLALIIWLASRRRRWKAALLVAGFSWAWTIFTLGLTDWVFNRVASSLGCGSEAGDALWLTGLPAIACSLFAAGILGVCGVLMAIYLGRDDGIRRHVGGSRRDSIT